MRDLEKTCMKKLSFKPLIYRRYVDDVFCIIPSNKVDYMKKVFNEYNPKISFTSEMEKNKFLSFLDVLVHNDNGQVKTNW